MELKEFRPHHHASNILDSRQRPWLKRMGRKRLEELRGVIVEEIVWTVKDYLRVSVNNLVLKRKLKAPLKIEDYEGLVTAMRRALRQMRAYKFGHKPMAFDAKNGYYRKGDEKAPFFTEAFLYALLGKDDARTLLGHFEDLLSIVGVEEE